MEVTGSQVNPWLARELIRPLPCLCVYRLIEFVLETVVTGVPAHP